MGCQSLPQTINVNIKLCPSELIWIPNTFTPDGNEHNQHFRPVITSGVDPFDFHMVIYNRWGEIIWESFDTEASWDGTFGLTLCPDGVYNWTIDFGLPKTDQRKQLFGNVRLIR